MFPSIILNSYAEAGNLPRALASVAILLPWPAMWMSRPTGAQSKSRCGIAGYFCAKGVKIRRVRFRLLARLLLFAPVLSSCSYMDTPTLSRTPVITIGTLYAQSGQFAASSLPEFAGLKFWVSQVDQLGGVYVGALRRRVRVRLVSYNDRSSAKLASSLYRRLLTVDHVDFLISDFGSVLTEPALALSMRSHVLLFDQTGTGPGLFAANNPYIVLCDLPTSTVWPLPLAQLLLHEHFHRVAIIYSRNEFDGAQDQTVAGLLTQNGYPPIANISVDTSELHYSGYLSTLKRLNPDAVLEFGYQGNDIAFLNELLKSSVRPRFVFTAFPGQLHQLLQATVGTAGLSYTFSYAVPPKVVHRSVTTGLTETGFATRFLHLKSGPVNFLNIAGYNTGLIFQAAAAGASTFSQLGMRAELNALSGNLRTLEGIFRINAEGAQTGETPGICELFPTKDGSTTIRSVGPGSQPGGQIKLGGFGS